MAIIGALVGLYFYQSSRRKDAEARALIAEVEGKNKILKQQEEEIKKEIEIINKNADELKERFKTELKDEEHKSLAERAISAKNRFGK